MQLSTNVPSAERDVLLVFLLAMVLVGMNFFFQGNIGINFSDEGFLWYGAAQTAAGQVPLRDFQSYDPGRYYWIALWAQVFGTGILGVRLSVAVFQLLGVFFGLLVVRRVVSKWWVLCLVGFLLVAWMFPRHKLFEHSLAMVAVYVGVCLLERPSRKRHFLAGVFVGIAAFFGRNHGLYSFLACVAEIAFIQMRLRREALIARLNAWGLGLVIGSVPLLAMAIVIPGFASAFLDSVLSLFRLGATNLSLPVPWPWFGVNSSLPAVDRVAHYFVGLGFVALPLFFLFSLGLLLVYPLADLQRQSVLVASTCVGIWYVHYAFSRADLPHLAQSLMPFLIGIVAMPAFLGARENSRGSLLVLSGLMVFTIGPAYLGSPFFQHCHPLRATCVQQELNGETLWLHPSDRQLIETVRQIVEEHVRPEEGIFIAPHWPTFYGILQRPSPTWQIYFIFPESMERQEEMISDLGKHKVRWVILGDVALDGQDTLRFRHTHSLLWQFLMREFEPVAVEGFPADYQLLRKKSPIPRSSYEE